MRIVDWLYISSPFFVSLAEGHIGNTQKELKANSYLIKPKRMAELFQWWKKPWWTILVTSLFALVRIESRTNFFLSPQRINNRSCLYSISTKKMFFKQKDLFPAKIITVIKRSRRRHSDWIFDNSLSTRDPLIESALCQSWKMVFVWIKEFAPITHHCLH